MAGAVQQITILIVIIFAGFLIIMGLYKLLSSLYGFIFKSGTGISPATAETTPKTTGSSFFSLFGSSNSNSNQSNERGNALMDAYKSQQYVNGEPSPNNSQLNPDSLGKVAGPNTGGGSRKRRKRRRKSNKRKRAL